MAAAPPVKGGRESAISMLRSLTTRHAAWSVGIYRANDLSLPPAGPPPTVFSTRRLLRGPRHIHTRADPFLLARGDRLLLFVEEQAGDRPGHIALYVTEDLRSWAYRGVVLKEPFHLAYPQLVEIDGGIYLIPESRARGEVRLYRFDERLGEARFERVLLRQALNDPTPVEVDGRWYILATSRQGLSIFHTDDLLGGDVVPHPDGPGRSAPALARCAGPVLRRDGRLYRLAQDGRERYGANISLIEIEELTPTRYRERLVTSRFMRPTARWNSHGSHHLSSAVFKGEHVIAVDGQTPDFWLHKITRRVGNAIDRLVDRSRLQTS